jgi:nucleotide-binding universal stress UspA family protein
MCSHGRGKAQQLFMGSMAQTIIGLGSIPVIIVHPDATDTLPEFVCRTILVPLDNDSDHAQTLPVSKELAGTFGAALHLSMVIELFTTLSGVRAVTSRLLPGTTSRLLEIATRNGEQLAQQLLGELLDQGYNARAEVLRGDPAGEIIKSAQANNADLIVLATHGKSGMEAFLAGSFSHKLCSLCTTPLLLLPVAGDPAG